MSSLANLAAFLIEGVFVDATLVVGAVVLIERGMRRRSAAVRHGVWAAAFAALAMLPFLRVATTAGAADARTETHQVAAVPAPQVQPEPSAGLPTLGTLRSSSGPIPLSPWLVTLIGVWVTGAAFQLLRLRQSHRRAESLYRTSRPAPPRVLQAWEAALSADRRSRGALPRMSEAVWSPAVIGVLRPRILLPASARQWSDEALLASLAHERAHLERFDPGIRLLAQVTRAAYWMNPLVHLAERRLAGERERACDDSIVRDGWNPLSYAELLVGLARQRRAHVCGGLEMTGGSSWLAGRVERILSRSVARDRLGVPAAFGMLTVAFLVGSAMAWSSFVRVESPVSIAVHLEDLAEGTALERRHAAWALGEREDARAVSSLISALADPDARVRGVAAWALGEIKDPRSAAALSAAVDDPEPRVREMAVVALGELGVSDGFEVVSRAREEDPLLRAPAEWALRQLHGDREDVPWMIEPGANEAFLGANQGQRSSPGSRVTLALPDLRSPDARVRAAAALEMGRAGDPRAVEPLLDALEDASPAVRAAAVWALDEINPSRR